ncbi:nucleotidyltransferase substrate binding protein, HI0074 family [Persephonella hydrogeniphila]|uniref:Nucleotidyltransferase substrate binding protein, HI0074 family n=1 Tax=Persephonella hydrogeniphila TaxID=198703 RepID=A0A285NDY4_9AQUI|nr:HI0074 family nucleotidyltransferase substrate-binding subunit [Persephonella hydrogeniphila]SNZ06136.1 nucleotidyltransferase substrate binding protein, HI0074 family [Persephonella hydrogeniphila]
MEKYSRALERLKKSFTKFKEVIENPVIPEIFKEEFLIEISTKRFEYTYESLWKTVKEFLRLRGIECNSPKSCFRELIKEGIVPEKFEKILAEMIVLRNILVHIYDEEQAKDIYERIKKKDIVETFHTIIQLLEKEKP